MYVCMIANFWERRLKRRVWQCRPLARSLVRSLTHSLPALTHSLARLPIHSAPLCSRARLLVCSLTRSLPRGKLATCERASCVDINRFIPSSRPTMVRTCLKLTHVALVRTSPRANEPASEAKWSGARDFFPPQCIVGRHFRTIVPSSHVPLE